MYPKLFNIILLALLSNLSAVTSLPASPNVPSSFKRTIGGVSCPHPSHTLLPAIFS